jgi:hypothetical protein
MVGFKRISKEIAASITTQLLVALVLHRKKCASQDVPNTADVTSLVSRTTQTNLIKFVFYAQSANSRVMLRMMEIAQNIFKATRNSLMEK